MSRKPISFGKITLNFQRETSDNGASSGFGTFGRPIQEQKEIEELTDDLENQHVQQVMGIKNFGKKAKNFDLEVMMERAKKTAQEVAKKSKESTANLENSDEPVIGPLPPSEQDEDVIGPPVPINLISKKPHKDETMTKNSDEEDSYDELSDSEDEDLPLEKRIPNTHEVILMHYTIILTLSKAAEVRFMYKKTLH